MKKQWNVSLGIVRWTEVGPDGVDGHIVMHPVAMENGRVNDTATRQNLKMVAPIVSLSTYMI